MKFNTEKMMPLLLHQLIGICQTRCLEVNKVLKELLIKLNLAKLKLLQMLWQESVLVDTIENIKNYFFIILMKMEECIFAMEQMVRPRSLKTQQCLITEKLKLGIYLLMKY